MICPNLHDFIEDLLSDHTLSVDTSTDVASAYTGISSSTTLVLISVGAILIFALIFLLVGYVLSRLKNCSSTRYTSGSSSDGIEIDRIKSLESVELSHKQI